MKLLTNMSFCSFCFDAANLKQSVFLFGKKA